MINSGREWDWMEDDCRIQRAIEQAMVESLSEEGEGRPSPHRTK